MSMIRTLIPLIVIGISLAGCELSPKLKEQSGYRGTGMDQIHTKAAAAKATAANYIPPPPYPLEARDGPLATTQYQNIKVLNDLSADEFNRSMLSITEWVAPKAEGCNYCHNPANMASDEKYQKVAARRMIQMTRNINTNWQNHVQKTGVTCWTCHRGNAIPAYKWSSLPPEPMGILGNHHGQNLPDKNVGYASLPNNIYEPYLLNASNVRVESTQAYGPGAKVPIQSAEQTYGLMMRVSTALGVNCTYCHNTNSFSSWKTSTPARAQAWYGIRMARNINSDYIQGLGNIFPADQKGPLGDPYKVNCMTCHQGVNKPLGGVSMLKDHPAFAGSRLGSSAPVALSAPKADPNATAASCTSEFGKALAGRTVEFDTGKATIRSVSTPLLDSLVQIAGRCSGHHMEVGGHTDATGDVAANVALSKARATAVETYLVGKGVAARQMTATGFGSSKPVDTSGTPAGNQRNRRIEVSVSG
jgi:photosynthetic reaction center cytochrome c subunit